MSPSLLSSVVGLVLIYFARFFTILAGYVLAKIDYFPKAASRGASEVTMNVALPALIFANVVPAFTPSNISALGPLFLVAFTYQAIGFFAGLVIREVCYVPRNFWQGIIVMTGMSNWGNLRKYTHVSTVIRLQLNIFFVVSSQCGCALYYAAAPIQPRDGP